MPGPYTMDASVFLNAFLPREPGHAQSQALLDRLQHEAVPMIAPTLLLPETAAAIGRGQSDPERGVHFSAALARLPYLILVDLDQKLALQAAEIAARLRLRGSDAVYAAVALRFNTPLVSLDIEQRSRCASIVRACTPGEALNDFS